MRITYTQSKEEPSILPRLCPNPDIPHKPQLLRGQTFSVPEPDDYSGDADDADDADDAGDADDADDVDDADDSDVTDVDNNDYDYDYDHNCEDLDDDPHEKLEKEQALKDQFEDKKGSQAQSQNYEHLSTLEGNPKSNPGSPRIPSPYKPLFEHSAWFPQGILSTPLYSRNFTRHPPWTSVKPGYLPQSYSGQRCRRPSPHLTCQAHEVFPNWIQDFPLADFSPAHQDCYTVRGISPSGLAKSPANNMSVDSILNKLDSQVRSYPTSKDPGACAGSRKRKFEDMEKDEADDEPQPETKSKSDPLPEVPITSPEPETNFLDQCFASSNSSSSPDTSPENANNHLPQDIDASNTKLTVPPATEVSSGLGTELPVSEVHNTVDSACPIIGSFSPSLPQLTPDEFLRCEAETCEASVAVGREMTVEVISGKKEPSEPRENIPFGQSAAVEEPPRKRTRLATNLAMGVACFVAGSVSTVAALASLPSNFFE